ncbi:MAG: heme ABC exporter ATP-binding protein CcmA [Deinococcales bacterium]|nr:heme ABC exporter ATP-binding protein CcmA [Deinococcales bacterium]
MTPPAIELAGVTRRMGRELVLRGVDLEVAAGRLVVLRGGNGAGKTTLLRLLATRLKPTSGSARLFGVDVLKEPAAARARLGMLSVMGGSYPVLSARENLLLACDMAGAPRAAVGGLLERVGLAAAADKHVRTFSSGMKKRLGLARLLLLDPDLWLLDEPYAALDDDGKRLVDEVVAAARARGRTLLMASHESDREHLRPDAVLQLHDGRLRLAPAGRQA